MSHVTASDSSRISDSENYQPDHSFSLKVEERSAVASSALVAQRLSALGEMTGGIVHDFRNILAVIDSSLRLLAKSSNDPEGLHAFIAGARDGLDRGLRLTSQLLSFAKQRELEPQSANASELLKSLELFLKYGAGSAIRIVFELASDIPRCLIDPSRASSSWVEIYNHNYGFGLKVANRSKHGRDNVVTMIAVRPCLFGLMARRYWFGMMWQTYYPR